MHAIKASVVWINIPIEKIFAKQKREKFRWNQFSELHRCQKLFRFPYQDDASCSNRRNEKEIRKNYKKGIKIKIEVLINNSSQRNQFSSETVDEAKMKIFYRFLSEIFFQQMSCLWIFKRICSASIAHTRDTRKAILVSVFVEIAWKGELLK